jgi:creatinine amidohydrolase
MRDLGSATSPSVRNASTVLVPVGSVEQHGPHLPLQTDTIIAEAVASRVAQRLDRFGAGCIVAPAITYGASGEHQAFAGTSSVGTTTLRDLLIELVRSMRRWADEVVFVNGHGGNVDALTSAVVRLREEGHRTSWVPCTPRGGDLHAGHSETSILLHLAPWQVRRSRLERGNTQELSEIFATMRTAGVQAVSPNGVLGDPTTASAEAGAYVLKNIVNDVADRVSFRRVDSGIGMLLGYGDV